MKGKEGRGREEGGREGGQLAKKEKEKEKSPTQSSGEDPDLGALSAEPGADR